MASNNRIFYAIQAFAIFPDGASNTTIQGSVLHGIQGVSTNTNFNLVPIFEEGQISPYVIMEEIPDVTLNTSKVLDGNLLIYHAATQTAPTPTLVGRSTSKVVAKIGYFPDTNTSAQGGAISEVTISGLFVSSLNYRVEVGGNGTEEVGLVGTSKVWANDANILLGAPSIALTGTYFNDTDSPVLGRVVRRQDIIFVQSSTGTDINSQDSNPDNTVLPPEVFGITSVGLNPYNAALDQYGAHIQTISFSCDLNRESLDELGHRAPYARIPNFPVQVTTEIATISVSGDMISATESGIYSSGSQCTGYVGNLKNRSIRLATCDGLRIYTGLKNKLASVSTQGGDTGGGNIINTYTFTTYNDFTVMHSGDINTNFSFSQRAQYLVN